MTKTHPGPWFLEDEATVMTVLEILERRAEAATAKTKKSGRR
jgi:hypothetical protein